MSQTSEKSGPSDPKPTSAISTTSGPPNEQGITAVNDMAQVLKKTVALLLKLEKSHDEANERISELETQMTLLVSRKSGGQGPIARYESRLKLREEEVRRIRREKWREKEVTEDNISIKDIIGDGEDEDGPRGHLVEEKTGKIAQGSFCSIEEVHNSLGRFTRK